MSCPRFLIGGCSALACHSEYWEHAKVGTTTYLEPFSAVFMALQNKNVFDFGKVSHKYVS